MEISNFLYGTSNLSQPYVSIYFSYQYTKLERTTHVPRFGHLVYQPRKDPNVGPEVLEKGDEVEGCLVVPQRCLDFWRVPNEHVGHDQDGVESHEPSPCDKLINDAYIKISLIISLRNLTSIINIYATKIESISH